MSSITQLARGRARATSGSSDFQGFTFMQERPAFHVLLPLPFPHPGGVISSKAVADQGSCGQTTASPCSVEVSKSETDSVDTPPPLPSESQLTSVECLTRDTPQRALGRVVLELGSLDRQCQHHLDAGNPRAPTEPPE